MHTNYHLRQAAPRDAEALLQIYAPYVTETNITFEYEVPSVEGFQSRIENTLERYPYLVALDEQDRIIGYAYASAFKSRAAYDWSVETSIYVKTGIHGKGVGSLLYEELERLLRLQHVVNACACITATAEESIRFHKKFGYVQTAMFHKSGYKSGQWLDMIWMEKFLGPHTVPPMPFIPFSELPLSEKKRFPY